MRKVTAGLFHSIDGVVEAPDQWQYDQFDDELGAMFGKVLEATDTVILGRVGYEAWAEGFRRGPGDEFFGAVHQQRAEIRRLAHAQGPARLAELDADRGRRRCTSCATSRRRTGGEIAVMGGIGIVRHLFLAGLIDELTLITHPVIAGEGRRHLFQPGDPVDAARADQRAADEQGERHCDVWAEGVASQRRGSAVGDSSPVYGEGDHA